MVVDGFAGSGKTTFLRYFVRDRSLQSCLRGLSPPLPPTRCRPEPGSVRRQITRAIDLLESKAHLFDEDQQSKDYASAGDLNEVSGFCTNEKMSLPIAAILKSYTGSASCSEELRETLYFIKNKLRYLTAYFSDDFQQTIDQTPRERLGENSPIVLASCNFSDSFLVFLLVLFKHLDKQADDTDLH